MVSKGSRVRIQRGSLITGTHPQGDRRAGRSYVVEVHDVTAGYDYTDRRGERLHKPPQVCWVGAGGYWHYTDLENVEVVTT